MHLIDFRTVMFITFIALAVYVVADTSSVSSVDIQAGFEFLGNVDGKTLVRPIYSNVSDKLTYQDAIIKCTSAGYRIATIETQGQSDLLKPYACSPNFRWAWIDGVDFQTPDVFFSINTGKNLTFLDWVPGHPYKGKDNNNCIRFSCNSIDGAGFWEVECTSSYLTVICEA